MAIQVEQTGSNDEVVLRVASKSPADGLASAISHAVYDGKRVLLRCIGAGAVNQAVKAIAIAQGFTGQRGVTLLCRPGFVTLSLKGEEVSAIVIKVFPS